MLLLFVGLVGFPQAQSVSKPTVLHSPVSLPTIPQPLVPVFNVLTYHYDGLRTGWNQRETTLKAKNVTPSSFGLLYPTVPLDDQVDAQPLVVANQTIAGHHGLYEVVYVVTENDTVYAIDAATGSVLKSTSLGKPVSENQLPGSCNNNGPNVGINSTPVIDSVSRTMYVIAYTSENGTPVYRLHALDLGDLSDKVKPVPVDMSHGASHPMPNGGTYRFNSLTQRQRPGLLEANGNVYAAFGSFCDFDENDSRGWILGWQAGNLTPLAHTELTNSLTNVSTTLDCPAWNNNHPPCMLASVWMSGYGIASDADGNVFAVTGNSAPGTYDGVHALQESVVKISGDLSTVLNLFTPSDTKSNDIGVNAMDQEDNDFGSGGVLLLPDQSGKIPHLAVAQGKIGPLYVLNRDISGVSH
ncbi:MAG TPA: hypothetical protein VGZ00_07725, partial [Candidatus Baltobacteraceae bacterium]|nr:hypothetical protein [Candidatus Baltobacteraceae bacterium]